MELHFLKSTAILGILLLFYKLLLEKEDMHLFKRFYLLSSLVASIIVPFVSFNTYVEIPAQLIQIQSPALSSESSALADSAPYATYFLWFVFLIGSLFFALRFLLNLLRITKRIRRNPKVRTGITTKVLHQEDLSPHSFLDFIFLNKRKFESGAIPAEVLEHEKAHAQQKHSWDILLLELLQVLLWFHPLVYLLKKEIKLNHEFLADKAVLSKGVHPHRYQEILLSFSSNDTHNHLVHPINYSSIKKRFTVMKTQSSKKAIWLRSFLILPLLAVLLYSFSSKQVVYTSETIKVTSVPDTQGTAAEIQEIATEKMVEEYNQLAKYINEQDRDYLILRIKDFARMRYIYNLMTPVQKSKAEPFPEDMMPPPPPPPPAPPLGDSIPEPPLPPNPDSVKPFDVTQPIDPNTLPPIPPNPVDLMKEMASEGASFYLNYKEISTKEAMELVGKGGNLSIKVVEHYEFAPTVLLSTE